LQFKQLFLFEFNIIVLTPLSSMENDAKQSDEAAGNHWGIENSVHQVLDVGFREDESRKRKGDSAFCFSILRHIAMNLLRKEKTSKIGMRAKRLKAGWSDDYLAKVLAAT
ncbi:transposase, partial [Desulfococcaceae bacterium HSG9]|nr:transposase [Desulfococcaceae bacterium HSG9]